MNWLFQKQHVTILHIISLYKLFLSRRVDTRKNRDDPFSKWMVHIYDENLYFMSKTEKNNKWHLKSLLELKESIEWLTYWKIGNVPFQNDLFKPGMAKRSGGISTPPSPVLKISRQNEYFFMPALTQAYNSPSRNREMYRQIGDDELLSDVHSADRVIRR